MIVMDGLHSLKDGTSALLPPPPPPPPTNLPLKLKDACKLTIIVTQLWSYYNDSFIRQNTFLSQLFNFFIFFSVL